MHINIDFDRINFNDLGINEIATDMGLLDPLVDIPSKNTKDYKGISVNVSGKANKEELKDVAEYGIKSVPYYRTQAQTNPTYKKNIKGAPNVNFAREGTINKLQEVNEKLGKIGLELIVLDAHRSPVTQNILFAAFKEQFFEKIGCARSSQNGTNTEIIAKKREFYDKQATEFAVEFCSNAEGFSPSDSRTWTIHSTGGAVDVYLLDKKSGKVVDMGEEYFDNPKPITNTGYYEKMKDEELLPNQKGFRDARRVLYNAMTSSGFVNYGYECFHYSYKDPYWACVKGVNAEYGYRKSPREERVASIVASLQQAKKQK